MERPTALHTLKTLVYFRQANEEDVVAISKICYLNQASKESWRVQLHAYLRREFNPHHALHDRTIYVATLENSVIGFIAGHITQRANYPGQIQWIAVKKDYQRNGIGAELLWTMANWFIEKGALCVRADVAIWQGDLVHFYTSQKAEQINSHGLFWNDIRAVMRG